MGCWLSFGKSHNPKKIMEFVDVFVEILQQQRQTLEIVEDFTCEAKSVGHIQRFRIFLSSCFFPFLFFQSINFQLFPSFFGEVKMEKSSRSSYCKKNDFPQWTGR